MAQSTETNVTEKRYLQLNKSSWDFILATFKSSPTALPVIIINDLNYEFHRPNRNTNMKTSIIKQPWLDYDIMEPSFIIIPHVLMDEDAEDNIKGFIIPPDWMDQEVWATDEQ